jgi:CHAT domain-containing protein/Tfp pilus assembly protein PilF
MKNILIILFIFFSLLETKAQNQQAEKIFSLADSLFTAGDFALSLPLYKKADSLYKNSDVSKSIYCQCRMADCYVRQGDLKQSLSVAEAALSSCTDDLTELKTDVLNTLGFIYLEKGRQDLAEDYLNNSLNIAESKGVSTLTKAKLFNNLGLLHWVKGELEAAAEYMLQALEIRKKVFDENDPVIAASYNNLGLVYSSYDPEKAVENYEKALQIYKEKYSLIHPTIANTYTNIGIMQRKEGDYTASLASFDKALQILLNLYGKDHFNIGFAYSNIGETYSESRNLVKALEFQEKALSNYKHNFGAKHPEIASTYNAIGNIYFEQKKFNLALKSFQNALIANLTDFNTQEVYKNPAPENYYNSQILLSSLLHKARALEALHHEKTLKLEDLKTAFNTYLLCDTLLTKIRQVRTSKNDKIELGKLGAEIYEDAINVAFELSTITVHKNYYLQKAFYLSEKNKVAVLLESIAESKAKSFAGIPSEILEKEKGIKNNLTFHEQKLAQGPSGEEEKALRENIFNLKRDYKELVEQLEKSYPDYFNLKYNTKIATLPDVQKKLQEDEAHISYFIGDNRKEIYIFFITARSYKIAKTVNENLNKDITAFRNAIKLNVQEAYSAKGSSLYSSLFPFQIPSNIKKLIIIPEGKLGSIPFEALLTEKVKDINIPYKEYPFLIKKYSTGYYYSSTLFTESASRKNSAENNSALICAPVDFSNHRLNNLEGSRTEAESIHKLFQEKNISSSLWLLKEANENKIKKEALLKFRFIHLATHGIVNESTPELSQIYLYPDSASKEDGCLYSGDIYNLKFNADLIVLSACETGLGKVTKGEGIIGLTRALIYAGSRNIAVSLWTVSDASTSQMMIEFYKLFLKNQDKSYSDALREAKLKLISEEKFSLPYFWAPFILLGK